MMRSSKNPHVSIWILALLSVFFFILALNKCNDLGWLGYFIGKCEHLRELYITGSTEEEDNEEEEQRIIRAVSDGIARNRSIRYIYVYNLSNDGFATIARALGNMTQLEELNVSRCMDNDNTLVTLLESGVKLKKLSHNYHSPALATFAHGLKSIGSSLEELDLSESNVGNDGLLTLAEALADCTSIKTLGLSGNDFSMAAGGLRSLMRWLQRAGIQLDELQLWECDINDEGLQALIDEGVVNHCKHIDLSINYAITASGWRLLSTELQSERCCVQNLHLSYMSIGDDTAEFFARALVGNKTLRMLHLVGEDEENLSITPTGWSAFSKVLCDTSSINNTYISNHTIRELWREHEGSENIPRDLVQYLWLNERCPQHAARCKILMSHAHLDMKPLLRWELKCLPLAVNWFERAKPCLTLSIDDGESFILEESYADFESRRLSALYEFVSEYPKKVLERRGELTLVASYDDKIAMVQFANKKLREDMKKREREVTELHIENKRMKGILESVRSTVNY